MNTAQIAQWLDIVGRIDDLYCIAKFGIGTKVEWMGAAGINVEADLRSYGVTIYCRRVTKSEPDEAWHYSCRVTKGQGRWAEYVMRRLGYNITSPLIDKSNANVKPGPIRRTWKTPPKQKGFTGAITGMMMGNRKQPFKEIKRGLRRIL